MTIVRTTDTDYQKKSNRPWSLCENLGATESIITACAVMTHANMVKEDRLAVGTLQTFLHRIEDCGCGLGPPFLGPIFGSHC